MGIKWAGERYVRPPRIKRHWLQRSHEVLPLPGARDRASASAVHGPRDSHRAEAKGGPAWLSAH